MVLIWGNRGPQIQKRDVVRNLKNNKLYIVVSITPLVLKDLAGNIVKEIQTMEYRHIGTFNKNVTL
tara:strand:- start:149 stop:346 length:198 start_codon:yes stop_codon:yes gene_type:complete